jgi:hypothetical protein
VTILRKKFSPPIEVARRDGGIEVYDIGNNATLAGYANTSEIPVPAADWGATQKSRGLVRRYQQGRAMLNHWLIELIGHLVRSQ